jgi:hypothetical protein
MTAKIAKVAFATMSSRHGGVIESVSFIDHLLAGFAAFN